MNTIEHSPIKPTHKILLVTIEPLESLDHLFSSLHVEGITSTTISKEELDTKISSVKTTFLWIHTPYVDEKVFLEILHYIPELTGVLFCIDGGMSRLDILRSIALSRHHYVAIIGALMVRKSDADENFGFDICRRSGIPYLGSAMSDNNKKWQIDKNTIELLLNMAQ